MQNIRSKIEASLDLFLDRKITPLTWLGSFFGIVLARLFLDDFIANTNGFNILSVNSLHNFLFFGANFLLLWLLVSFWLKIKPFRLANVFLFGLLLIVLPPALDMLKTGGSVYWSSYVIGDLSGIWLNYATFFNRMPSGTVYFGTKFLIVLAVLGCSGIVYVKTRDSLKAVLCGILAYTSLFFMASFPSWVAIAAYAVTGAKKLAEINTMDVIQPLLSLHPIFGLLPTDIIRDYLAFNLNLIYYFFVLFLLSILFLFSAKEKFLAVIKNARFPQLIYHTGLFMIGLGLGALAYPQNLSLNIFAGLAAGVLAVSIWLAWLTSVVVNDIYDYAIDEVSNPKRPLQKNIFTLQEYWQLGIFLFILSLFGGLLIDIKFAAMLMFYQFIAWAYSAPPFRLKRFPGVATFTSSLASLLILLMGFTVFSGDQNITGLSWRVIILLILTLTLSLPIKDFKDIEGDKKYGIMTLPVILGMGKSRLAVSIGVFISFMASVFLLHELELFWWALLFGTIAFFVVINEKIKPHNLFWWVLGIVTVYGFILTKFLFF